MIGRVMKMGGPHTTVLLLLLLCADFALIVSHIVIGIFDPDPALCNISGICAWMNVYHLIKLFSVIVLFVYILRSTGHAGYASWILMFTSFFIDDALLLHQRVGDQIAKVAETYLPSNLVFQPRVSELAVLALAGMFLLAVVVRAYVRADHQFRKVSNDMFLFIAALVFFGLLVDVATAFRLGHLVKVGLGFVEDGGELIVYSLILWEVALLAIRQGKPDLPLVDLPGSP